MGLYISIPLPGPFRYSKRIGGKRAKLTEAEKRPPRIFLAYKHLIEDLTEAYWGE